jgi:hypothetical protein
MKILSFRCAAAVAFPAFPAAETPPGVFYRDGDFHARFLGSSVLSGVGMSKFFSPWTQQSDRGPAGRRSE